MLKRFFSRDSKSALPKDKIEVVCPLCGAAQREPRLVVTTFCRNCGEHLRVEKRGRVIASSHINPVPSTVYPATKEPPAPPPQPPKPPDKPPESKSLREIISAALMPDKTGRAEHAPLGLGTMMGFKDDPKEPPRAAAPLPAKTPDAPLPPLPAIPTAKPAAPPQTTLYRMREQSHRQHYFKEVECFECRNTFKVGRSAKSTNCPSCGSYICLDDLDINVPSTVPIRTRGDVLIRRNGNVQTSEIICRDLKLYGMVSAAINCSGEMLVRATGTIIGDIRCHRLLIERGTDVHFMNTIHADEVEIRARASGNIECSGPVCITCTGRIHGDVTARAITIEPGGQLDGAMNILMGAGASALRKQPAAPPLPRQDAGV